jgi:hypothetical protein
MTAFPDQDYNSASRASIRPETRGDIPGIIGSQRVTIPEAVVEKLVALGVPNRSREIGSAVTEITKFGIDQATAYLPDLTDAVALNRALTDRTEELTRVNMELLKAVAELSLIMEGRDQLQALNDLVNPE